MTLPNFLIVGAAKAGTTALHTYLQQHPQIYMTPTKETNFFAFEGQDINFAGKGDEALKDFSITDLETYKKQFTEVTNEIAIGEACPSYLYYSEAAQRIKKYIPNTRIIIILRNPVTRAYANYLHLVRDRRETCEDFESALETETERIDNNWEWFWHYTKVGFYSQQIENYYKLFDKSKIAIYLYEDLKNDAVGLLKNIFTFLEIDNNFSPDFSIRPNKSGKPKNPILHQILTRPNPIKTILKPLFPAKLRQKIQHQNLAKPKIKPETQTQLIKVFQQDILACQKLIDRDLSSWLNIDNP